IQQVFLKLSENNYRALRELDCYKESSVRLFVYAVATNTALDCLRASQVARRPSIAHSLSDSDDMEEYVASHADPSFARDENPEERYIQMEMIKQVLAVVDSESDDQTRERNRLIFFLAHREGYTRSEIAARIDIDLKRTGINSFLNRIKKKIAELYYGELSEETSGKSQK